MVYTGLLEARRRPHHRRQKSFRESATRQPTSSNGSQIYGYPEEEGVAFLESAFVQLFAGEAADFSWAEQADVQGSLDVGVVVLCKCASKLAS